MTSQNLSYLDFPLSYNVTLTIVKFIPIFYLFFKPDLIITVPIVFWGKKRPPLLWLILKHVSAFVLS